MRRSILITESEWIVMKVLWNDSPQGLPEILDSLKHTHWRPTTIQTYLARLVKKGVLTTRRVGRGFLYSPTMSEYDCRISESKTFLERIYNGSLSHMVMDLKQSGNLSEEDMLLLKNMVVRP